MDLPLFLWWFPGSLSADHTSRLPARLYPKTCDANLGLSQTAGYNMTASTICGLSFTFTKMNGLPEIFLANLGSDDLRTFSLQQFYLQWLDRWCSREDTFTAVVFLPDTGTVVHPCCPTGTPWCPFSQEVLELVPLLFGDVDQHRMSLGSSRLMVLPMATRIHRRIGWGIKCKGKRKLEPTGFHQQGWFNISSATTSLLNWVSCKITAQ